MVKAVHTARSILVGGMMIVDDAEPAASENLVLESDDDPNQSEDIQQNEMISETAVIVASVVQKKTEQGANTNSNAYEKSYDRHDSFPYSEKTKQMSNQQHDNGDSTVHNTPHRPLMERPLFFCCRHVYNIPNRRPRCYSICVVIILPLWFLVLLSMVSGYFLANLEAPLEVESNDGQLAGRASLIFELNRTYRFINELPRLCFDKYQDRNASNTTITDRNATFEDLWGYFQNDLEEYMRDCTDVSQDIINYVKDSLEQVRDYQPEQLTFNWIRCFNKTAVPGGRGWFLPSESERDAVKLANQTIFFTETWEQQQEAFYYEYLGDNNSDPTLEEQTKAFAYSINLATGDQDCNPNSQGTAWFWFTVMTTVGK